MKEIMDKKEEQDIQEKVKKQVEEAIDIIKRNNIETLIIIGRSDKEKFHCIIGPVPDLVETIVLGRERDSNLEMIVEASNEVKRRMNNYKVNN